MAHFEHFYIKDVQANKRGWDDVYHLLTQIETHIAGIDTSKPDSFSNRDHYTFVFDCASFLHKLFTDQAVRLGDSLFRLSVLINMSRSILTIFEDERMDNMPAKQCEDTKQQLDDKLQGILTLVNKQKFIIPVDNKTVVADILEDNGQDPVLSSNDSYDNFTDAMRLLLRRFKDLDAKSVEKLLSPQERLFHDIRDKLNKTISNFSTATAKVHGGRIQFARGTIAVQGRVDQKGLKLIPEYHVVQMAGTQVCPGFSSHDSDIMTPTIFFHNQVFVVFDPARIPAGLTYVSDSRRDKITKMRAYIMESPKCQVYRDVLEKALQHKLFPGLVFIWLLDAKAADKLDIRRSIKAELAF